MIWREMNGKYRLFARQAQPFVATIRLFIAVNLQRFANQGTLDGLTLWRKQYAIQKIIISISYVGLSISRLWQWINYRNVK